MAINFALAQQLLADAFVPQPEPERLAEDLVIAGIFIASSLVLSLLNSPPQAAVTHGSYLDYAFGVGLATTFLFGVGMIVVGFLVSDDPARYRALGRNMRRVFHVVLASAALCHVIASSSTFPANNTTNK